MTVVNITRAANPNGGGSIRVSEKLKGPAGTNGCPVSVYNSNPTRFRQTTTWTVQTK
jgi:hypothetical protein